MYMIITHLHFQHKIRYPCLLISPSKLTHLIIFCYIYPIQMNLVNSKIIKSSRPLINRSVQTLSAYSCELYIESFKISHRGYVYFVWSSNSSQIQSLKYESTGKLMQVKETLTISLRIASKNGKDLPTNTYIKLMAESGEELDEFELNMNNLTAQFKEMEIPMDRGLVNVKIRRKIMNIGEDQGINFQAGYYRSIAHRNEDKSMTNIITGEYESLQEELGRTKKELEDAIYLNNKLKNDRDVLLVTKQELELQIETMIVQVTKEISVLREHYDNRMSIREHCYEQEIENLLNIFNSNADQSRKTVELIMKQKVKLEDEIKPINERLRAYEQELVRKNEDCLRLEMFKSELETLLSNSQETSIGKDKEIEALHHQKEEMQATINSQSIKIQNLSCDIDKHKENIGHLQDFIKELQLKVKEVEVVSQGKDRTIIELQEKLIHYQERQNGSQAEKEHMLKQIGLLEEGKGKLLAEIEQLNGRLQQFEYEMEFNENVMGQLKKQQAQKEEELYNQLDSLQHLYSQKMEDIIINFQGEKDQLISINARLEQQKHQSEGRVRQLENNLQTSEIKLNEMDGEINSLSKQIRNTEGSASEKDMLINELQAAISKQKLQIEQLKTAEKEKHEEPAQKMDLQLHKKNSFALEQTNKELLDKIKGLESEIKRLSDLLQTRAKEVQILEKEKKQHEEIKKQVEKTQKDPIDNKSSQSIELRNGTFKREEVNEIVQIKDREIAELRKRVDYLQNLYDSLQAKLDEIAKKYPQIEIGSFQLTVPRPQQWCDSEQEQEKKINQQLFQSPQQEAPYKRRQSLVSRKNSIGAIIEKDEEMISSPKFQPERKIFEAQSEKRLGEDYNKGFGRRQSFGKVTIEVPKGGGNIRRQGSHASYDLSQKSGSYVKVSHSKKIKELQEEIKQLDEKLKKYEAEIGEHVKTQNALRKQTQLAKQTKEKSNKPQKNNVEKESKQSQVFIEDERLKNFMHESQIKQFQIQKMNLKVGELEDNLKNERLESTRKVSILEIKLAEGDKRLEELTRRCESLAEANKNLQKLVEEWQEKLRKEKDSSQDARLAAKQLQMHLDNAQNQLKKLRSLNETLEDKVQKMSGSESVIKELNKQLDDLGKKGLDQTRIINHLKLQKDAVEEELRLIKKRQNDHIRISTEWQEKAASLERAIQEQKRKEGKFKRQIEEAQEELRRAKFNTKKVEEELQSLHSAQATWQSQRRKHLDQISNLQDQLSRKDYEYSKINKQLEKWKMRAEEKQELRMGKKSELREQIDRLESELIRRQKKILEETEQNKLLRGRLELLERQNKRIMQQKNQSYGEKLKYYVDEMSNIKKLLQEYQNENSRLKIDNNDLYEQLEITRMNFDKLQMKYEENIEREENILTDLQSYINQVGILKDRLTQAHGDIDQAESAFVNQRKEFEQAKLYQRKILEKLDISERNLERALAEIQSLKIKISQFETNSEINGKIGERYRVLQRKKSEIEQEYRRIKSEYDNIINLFVYKREDLEKAVADARGHERRLKDEEIQKINEECGKTIVSKTQRLQQEILDLYNENNKARAELQAYLQENGRQKGRLAQLQNIAERFGPLQDENQAYKGIVEELKQQLRKKNDKINKLDLSIQGIEAECNSKQRQIAANKNRIKQLDKTIEKLNTEIETRRRAERQLQDALLQAGQSKNRQRSEEQYQAKQRESQLIQQYQSKIHTCELQIQKLKDKQARYMQENGGKMKKLEQKMDEMQQALKQRQKAIEGHYEAEMQELQNSLLRLSQELEEKLLRIDELNEAVIILEGDNKDLTKQNQDIKYQSQEERHILEGELTRLKNKFKQAETNYLNNIKSLEEEILKNAQKANISGSRLKTNQAEDRIGKRYEEKLKNKDRKIQELKENIYTLQETIVKLRKKENSYESAMTEVQRLKFSIQQFEKQRKNIEGKYDQELNRNSDMIRQLKREILLIKESEERLKLLSEEKIFENESISSELRTMRELYQQLQKELQKRKNNLTLQLEEQSTLQYELRTRQSRIIELEEKLIESMKVSKEQETDAKKKSVEIKKYIEIISELQRKEQNYNEQIAKLTNQLTITKKNLQQLSSSAQQSKTETNKMRMELTRLRKTQEELRSACISKEESVNQIKKVYEELTIRFKESQEISRRYTIINEHSREYFGYGIEQALDKFRIHLQEKDEELNQLIEQIQQLKFLNERKYLDYDELKKENFQLQIKVEDMDILNDQLEALRKICDKLQQEKKNSVFREEVLRMQIENLANNGSPELRNRIQAILANPNVPSFTNFSFY